MTHIESLYARDLLQQKPNKTLDLFLKNLPALEETGGNAKYGGHHPRRATIAACCPFTMKPEP